MSSSETTAPEAEEAPVETDELREGLVARLGELLGDAVVGHHILPGTDLWVLSLIHI